MGRYAEPYVTALGKSPTEFRRLVAATQLALPTLTTGRARRAFGLASRR